MYNIDSVKSYHVSCLISTPSVSSFSIPLQRLKGCGSQEGEAVLEGIAALREFDKGVLRKGIERIRVFGEGRIEVVWKGGDMFGGGDL